MKISVVRNVLDANERIARDNRAMFDEKGIFVINLMSGPGAGKTSLIEKTIIALKDKFRIAVIEGDIQDTHDAQRVAALGIPVVQINTGTACHLDGNMIRDAFPGLNLNEIDLLIIENVGNLVCPAEFRVGENFKAMILSTPEGADKPSKYPLMFQESRVLLINKMDLMQYVSFDIEKAKRDALGLNKGLSIFEISCRTDEGLDAWIGYLSEQIESFRKNTR